MQRLTSCITLTLLIFAPNAAFAYCSEPSAPYCASSYGRFDDEYQFSSCKREMESYQSEVEDFQQCRKRQVDEANDTARRATSEAEDVARKARNEIDEAVSNYNDAVRSFNSRAGG
ncbi:hypothetical protein [Agrobacterium rosae]|uniref:hypothetical protein n=1 Tax=Agrobacterium rosae TaxID=1972867 RepID=UPI0020340F22|nr:hypothetical protein [Agrobacterium rosae]MCM2432117.1 nucleotide exchange factor GrpE [Agrobacterium rosae]